MAARASSWVAIPHPAQCDATLPADSTGGEWSLAFCGLRFARHHFHPMPSLKQQADWHLAVAPHELCSQTIVLSGQGVCEMILPSSLHIVSRLNPSPNIPYKPV